MPPLNGIYHASLQASDLAGVSGLHDATVTYVDASGTSQGTASGLTATTAGQPGLGHLSFPLSLDATRPARINVHLCIGSSTASADNNQLAIYFSDGTNPANGLYFSAGMNSMQLKMWGANSLANYGATGGIPSGTCGSLFMDWIGTGPGGVDGQGNEQVWAGWIPDNATDLQAPNRTYVTASYQPRGVGFSAVLSASMLSNMTGIYVSNASASSMVTGVYVSQGRLDGPSDGAMPVPGLFQPVVLDAGNIVPSYQSNEVWIPPTYGSLAGDPVVQTYHPNGNASDIHFGRFGVYANLFNAGYVLVSITGDNGYGYSAWGGANYGASPTSSSWGGPSGDAYRTAVMALVRQHLPNANQYFRMGLSMGAEDELMDEIRNPGASGIALYSGMVSLEGAWNEVGQPAPGGGTFGDGVPNIEYGWGDWYLALQGNNVNQTPESSTSYWQLVSSTLTGLPSSYYNPRVYMQKGAWNPATAYNQNDIVVRPYTGTIAGLASGDPSQNFTAFAHVAIQGWAESNDSTIPSAAWQTAFIEGVTAAGNPHAISNVLSDCPSTGGCHISMGVFNPTNNQPWNTTTNVSPTLAWFNSLRVPWPTTQSTGSYTSEIADLSGGAATINIPAGSLNVGTDTLTAVYTPDLPGLPGYFSASGSASVMVGAAGQKETPAMAVTPSASSITSVQALTVTVTIGGRIGMPAPTGTVTLTSGSYASAPTALSNGSLALDVPAGSLALGVNTLTAAYSGDGNYNPTAGTASITVTDARLASFTVNGTGITVSPGATTGNTSTIAITPANGFSGSVVLSAVISGGPSGASDFPTASFGSTSPVTIAGARTGTARLTISTTPASSNPRCIATSTPPMRLPWSIPGVASLALVLGIRGWRRRWRVVLAMMSLLVVLTSGAVACGNGGAACKTAVGFGTTRGTYTVTVTGTSGTTTSSCVLTLVVQ